MAVLSTKCVILIILLNRGNCFIRYTFGFLSKQDVPGFNGLASLLMEKRQESSCIYVLVKNKLYLR